jgi:ribosomal protein S18 acetylase RimI-like enzyme
MKKTKKTSNVPATAGRLCPTPDVEVRLLRTRIDGVPGAAITAFVGNRFVGAVTLSHLNSKSASVTNLFVALDFRRLGIARRLIEECAFRALEYPGCECIGLIVQGKNPARYFYPKVGFSLAYEYSDKSLLFSRSVRKAPAP